MPTFIPENTSFGTQIARGLGGGLGQGFSQAVQQKQKNRSQMEILREKASLDRQTQIEKLRGQSEAEKENYKKIEKAFGKEFAEVWLASPTGARTALEAAAIQQGSRKLPVSGLFGKEENKEEKQQDTGYQLNTEGMSPKDIVSYKSALRKENTPLYTETKEKQKSYNELNRDVKILRGINKRKNLPEGFGKLLINPETGAPYELVTAVKNMHPDVQQWVKTIARQATQAQGAFPGRVTNFDLTQYMRQFPSLFNTYEGREIILDQMDLVNQANKLMTDAIDKVYAKYKLSGITPEDAQSMAEEMVKDKIAAIDEKLFSLGQEGELLAEPPTTSKENEGRIPVYDEQGNEVGDIDASEIDQLPEGYTTK